MALRPASLDRTRLVNRPAVEQELFGQGRFTRVGVGDDGKIAARFDSFGNFATGREGG